MRPGCPRPAAASRPCGCGVPRSGCCRRRRPGESAHRSTPGAHPASRCLPRCRRRRRQTGAGDWRQRAIGMAIEPGDGIHAGSVVVDVEVADDIGANGLSMGSGHRAAQDERERADGHGHACGYLHECVDFLAILLRERWSRLNSGKGPIVKSGEAGGSLRRSVRSSIPA